MAKRFPTPGRRSIRAEGYDYTQEGAYFITICTTNRKCLLGEVVNGEVQLNEIGKVVEKAWLQTPEVRPNLELDAFVVMPNHFHAILFITGTPDQRATRRVALTGAERPVGLISGSLGAIVGQFKSIATKMVKQLRKAIDSPVWQRNYYEHVIRNEESLSRIREYIQTNPQRWDHDRENPRALGKDDFDTWLASFKTAPGK